MNTRRTRTLTATVLAAIAVLAALAPTAGASPVPEPAPVVAPPAAPSVDVDRAFALHLAGAPSRP